VEAYSISFSVEHSLANTEVICLSSMTVSSGALELLDRFLLQLGHCFALVVMLLKNHRAHTCSNIGEEFVNCLATGERVCSLVGQENT
jgi:hypothetical protein